jgi:hypothetical protein
VANGETNGDWRMVRNILIGFASIIVAGYLAWSASCHVGDGNRITKLETKFDYVVQKLEKIDSLEELLRDIRNDQKRREKKER